MGRKHWQQWYFYLVVTIALISLGLLLRQSLLPQGPAAMAGVLDLREHLRADEVVRLNGSWEFYFGQLLWPSDFPAAEGLGSLQQVPGAWPDYQDVVPQNSTEFTAATYRLRVLVPEQTMRFGLKTTSIHANARVLVNGEEILLSGKPGLDQTSSELRYQPEVGYFEASGPELEIIVQARLKRG